MPSFKIVETDDWSSTAVTLALDTYDATQDVTVDTTDQHGYMLELYLALVMADCDSIEMKVAVDPAKASESDTGTEYYLTQDLAGTITQKEWSIPSSEAGLVHLAIPIPQECGALRLRFKRTGGTAVGNSATVARLSIESESGMTPYPTAVR